MESLIVFLLPYLVQFATPVAVALLGSLLVKVTPKLPKLSLPIFAVAIGEALNQLPEMLAGVPGLPPGAAGALGVFIREVVDQTRKLWRGTAKTIDGVPILRPGIEIE